MRLSQGYWSTYREVPAEAQIPSHQLMLRAGLVHKSGSGLYDYLPIMVRVIQKVEKIIRTELNKVPCYEMIMSVMTPSELWNETQRLEAMGHLMLKAKDRHEKTLCMSPTNEESVTNVFRRTIFSHKQLPVTLYQINTKFRDEIRPRFGVMRAREFTMMDAYSFHMNKESLNDTYEKIKTAYSNAFDQIGLKYCVVQADPGAMADKDAKTHEFQVLAQSGEDELVKCTNCEYAANTELSYTLRELTIANSESASLTKVLTPNCGTIEEVCQFLKAQQIHSLKSIVVMVDNLPVLLMLLGDDQLNDIKVQKIFPGKEVHWAHDGELVRHQFIKGFIGPAHLPSNIRVIFDKAVQVGQHYVIGANEKDYHFTHFTVDKNAEFYDMRKSTSHDKCSLCNHPVEILRGIEIGHVFQLGDKYTKAMKTMITDDSGHKIHPLMGCYGIGVTRIVASAIEQCHDAKGIIWPKSIAPYQVYLSSLGKANMVETLDSIREECASLLTQNEIEFLHDDRHATAGVIFNDADLLGLPIRVIVGERHWSQSKKIEVTLRKNNESHLLDINELVPFIKDYLNS